MEKSYPFSRVHMHSEDAVWLRKRWDKYCSAKLRLDQEREKEHPDHGVINELLHTIRIHKYNICETLAGKGHGSERMLKEAFGDDVFEWMKENGINRVKREHAAKRHKDY